MTRYIVNVYQVIEIWIYPFYSIINQEIYFTFIALSYRVIDWMILVTEIIERC